MKVVADPEVEVFAVNALIGVVVETDGPAIWLAIVYRHEIVLVQVSLLERDGCRLLYPICLVWMVLVVFGQTVVQVELIDELDAPKHQRFANVRGIDLTLEIRDDPGA